MARFIKSDLYPLWLFILSVVGILLSIGLCNAGKVSFQTPTNNYLASTGIYLFLASVATLVLSLVWGLVVFIIGLTRSDAAPPPSPPSPLA